MKLLINFILPTNAKDFSFSKALRSFWSIVGQSLKVTKIRQNIRQNEALDVGLSKNYFSGHQRSKIVEKSQISKIAKIRRINQALDVG